jgi:hypothetical protein
MQTTKKNWSFFSESKKTPPSFFSRIQKKRANQKQKTNGVRMGAVVGCWCTTYNVATTAIKLRARQAIPRHGVEALRK